MLGWAVKYYIDVIDYALDFSTAFSLFLPSYHQALALIWIDS